MAIPYFAGLLNFSPGDRMWASRERPTGPLCHFMFPQHHQIPSGGAEISTMCVLRDPASITLIIQHSQLWEEANNQGAFPYDLGRAYDLAPAAPRSSLRA